MLRAFLKRRTGRGTALLELVLTLPFYSTALFGAIEFGDLFYWRAVLDTSCHAGVRRAAAGDPLGAIRLTTVAASGTQAITRDRVIVEYNSAPDGSGSWV